MFLKSSGSVGSDRGAPAEPDAVVNALNEMGNALQLVAAMTNEQKESLASLDKRLCAMEAKTAQHLNEKGTFRSVVVQIEQQRGPETMHCTQSRLL